MQLVCNIAAKQLNSDVARFTIHKKPCDLIFAIQIRTWLV